MPKAIIAILVFDTIIVVSNLVSYVMSGYTNDLTMTIIILLAMILCAVMWSGKE